MVGWCEGVLYLATPGQPTDIGLQLDKVCYHVAGKGRGGMFLFLMFSSLSFLFLFFPVPLLHLLYYLFYIFSPFLWETTHNDTQGRVVKPQHNQLITTRSNKLLARLGIENLDLILKERRLHWYGHVEHSNGAVKTAFHIQVEGKRGPWRPKMAWKQLTERDCREWKHSAINPC